MLFVIKLSGKRDSNPRPLAWEANALPTELLPRLYQTTANIANLFDNKRKSQKK